MNSKFLKTSFLIQSLLSLGLAASFSNTLMSEHAALSQMDIISQQALNPPLAGARFGLVSSNEGWKRMYSAASELSQHDPLLSTPEVPADIQKLIGDLFEMTLRILVSELGLSQSIADGVLSYTTLKIVSTGAQSAAGQGTVILDIRFLTRGIDVERLRWSCVSEAMHRIHQVHTEREGQRGIPFSETVAESYEAIGRLIFGQWLGGDEGTEIDIVSRIMSRYGTLLRRALKHHQIHPLTLESEEMAVLHKLLLHIGRQMQKRGRSESKIIDAISEIANDFFAAIHTIDEPVRYGAHHILGHNLVHYARRRLGAEFGFRQLGHLMAKALLDPAMYFGTPLEFLASLQRLRETSADWPIEPLPTSEALREKHDELSRRLSNVGILSADGPNCDFGTPHQATSTKRNIVSQLVDAVMSDLLAMPFVSIDLRNIEKCEIRVIPLETAEALPSDRSLDCSA